MAGPPPLRRGGLRERPRPRAPARPKPPRLDGRAEASLVALACSARPAGRARWTPRPLADAPVGLRLVPRVSPETVRRAQENDLAPHLKRQWRIPPEASGAFASAVEDVLDLCERPHDPARPVVCSDERPGQLLAEARPGTPIAPGRPARHDDEHRRTGSANAFGYFEPLRGWREVEVAARRTKQDVARCLRRLADGFYPHADTVPVALDNLGRHTKAALYAAFPPAEARPPPLPDYCKPKWTVN